MVVKLFFELYINLSDVCLTYLDFRNFTKYRKYVIEFNPDYLFHIGAYTDLEFCEKNMFSLIAVWKQETDCIQKQNV